MQWHCETCEFWDQIDTTGFGWCRINPPVILNLDVNEASGCSMEDESDILAGAWPRTHGFDWCGKHQPARVQSEQPEDEECINAL